MTRLSWSPIVERAAEIVRGYQTGVTLRQLFYRLVSEEVLPNTVNAYKGLSAGDSRGTSRRDVSFPRRQSSSDPPLPALRRLHFGAPLAFRYLPAGSNREPGHVCLSRR